jgi:hypothetical protein
MPPEHFPEMWTPVFRKNATTGQAWAFARAAAHPEVVEFTYCGTSQPR